MAHGVVYDRMKVKMARFDDAKRFAELAGLMAKHCECLSAEEYFTNTPDGDRLKIALSFDDGHLSVMKVALPILEKHQIPAVIYSTAASILEMPILWTDLLDLLFHTDPQVPRRWALEHEVPDNRDAIFQHLQRSSQEAIRGFVSDLVPKASFMRDSKWDMHWKLLGKAELQALARHPLITIGNHSLLHADLSGVPLDAAVLDCSQAKHLLEACIGQEVLDFAFPFSHLQAGLPESLARMGHSRIAGGEGNPQHMSSMVEGRFCLNPFVSARVQMLQILKGSYD